MRGLKNSSVFVSTSCLPGVEPIDSRLSSYFSHGLDAIELGAGVSVDEDSLSHATEIKCRFLVHNYFPPPQKPFVLNLASADSNISQRSLDFMTNALGLAARLGAPIYSIHAGFVTDPTSFGSTSLVFPTPDSPHEVQYAMSRFTTKLKILLQRAKDLGMHILVENNVCSHELRGKLLLQSADEFAGLLSDLDSSNLGVLLDTGHLNVSAHTLGFDPMAFIDQVAPFVRAIHVHDNDGTLTPINPLDLTVGCLACCAGPSLLIFHLL